VLSDGDGGTSINYDTTITVTPNVPPTLDAIADPVAINEDASQQTINLTGITAGGGESQPLQVTATSNNTGLIPNPTVTYTSPNTTGSLAYTPVANTFGTAIVTVTVTDGGPDGNFGTPDDNGTFSRMFTGGALGSRGARRAGRTGRSTYTRDLRDLLLDKGLYLLLGNAVVLWLAH
jgi:hypothetical protein